jgi:hypothetical protein
MSLQIVAQYCASTLEKAVIGGGPPPPHTHTHTHARIYAFPFLCGLFNDKACTSIALQTLSYLLKVVWKLT